MMKNIFVTTFLFTAVCMFSCKKAETPQQQQSTSTKQMNVSYGTDPRHTMDIYLPAGRNTSTTRLVVFIHGGGWSGGDKTEMTQYIDTFMKYMPDWAVININYRLASGSSNLFPTQENDVKLALDFINSKRNEYLISDKWALLGASAGGHLSLLHAFKYTSPIKIKAVVNFFGPSDMAAMYNNPASPLAPPNAIAWVMNGTPTTNPNIYLQSSPINFISAQSTPTITLQGGSDPLVSPSQQTVLHAKLDQFGVANQLKIYPGLGHGWAGADMANSFQLTKAFLQQHVP